MAPPLTRIHFMDKRFVALGDGRTYSSSDGASFEPHAAGTDKLWNLAHGEGQYLAVGQGGAVLTSTDGTTWQSHRLDTSRTMTGAAYGNGRFVAVGDVVVVGTRG